MSHIFRVIIGRANVAYPRSNSRKSVAGAVVAGAIVTGAIVGGVIFAGAIVGGAIIGGAIVAGANVAGSNVGGANVAGAKCLGAFVAEHLSHFSEQLSAEHMSPEHMSWNLLNCGVVVRALDSRVRGSGFESRSVRTPLDKAFCPQLSLSTQV